MLATYPTVPDLQAGNWAWIDLLNPTDDEVARVEHTLNLTLPSREVLSEIESSSRLSKRDAVLFLSMPVVANAHDLDEDPSPLGFVLSEAFLVTIRYTRLRSFEAVASKFSGANSCSSIEIFSTLIEEMVDVSADLLEEIAGKLDAVSKSIFKKTNLKRGHPTRSNKRLHKMLVDVGNAGERLSRVRDSILGLQRIVPFVSDSKQDWIDAAVKSRLDSAKSDIQSLADYEIHLYTKVQFLLDATLGFVNTKQNDIFTVLTIASVVGIPPTLVASIYGMNFKNMPELDWAWGYQFGLGLILLSTIVPIVWLKWRGWF